jgi:hypothetical protein
LAHGEAAERNGAEAPAAPRLDLEHLAAEAEAAPEWISRLVEIGAIAPAADGTFGRGDVIRARVVAAFEAEGFSLDQMATAIRERAIALESLPLFYPDPSPRTGRSFGEFVEELGPRGELVSSILGAMGLSAPAATSRRGAWRSHSSGR